MKIVSDDSRIVDELFDYLDIKGIEVDKLERPLDKVTSKRPMGGLETYLSMGANATAILTGLAVSYQYITKNHPNWYLVFIPFSNDKIETTYEEYEKMSDNAKKAISENYDVLIKKK